MTPVGCNCGKNKGTAAYVVRVPGQADRRVVSEDAAKALTSGIRGASYSAVAS